MICITTILNPTTERIADKKKNSRNRTETTAKAKALARSWTTTIREDISYLQPKITQ